MVWAPTIVKCIYFNICKFFLLRPFLDLRFHAYVVICYDSWS
jgi:hypothetical protein